MKTVEYYKRSVDAGHGTQFLETMDGIVNAQWLTGKGHYYTGDGNPEFVGTSIKSLRGNKFRKVSRNERMQLLMDRALVD